MLEKIAKERRDYPEILKGKDRVITEKQSGNNIYRNKGNERIARGIKRGGERKSKHIKREGEKNRFIKREREDI